MADLSIIILNWNTRDLLGRCLESIYANAPKYDFEIIVVDNNSDEEISGIEERFAEIRLIRNAYNYGFAVGNNIGYRQSSGKYVMTLNPDTLVFPGTIDRLIQELERDEAVGISVPALHGKKTRRENHSFFHLYFDSIIFRNISNLFEKYRRPVEKPFDVEFIGGTGYICRRSALADDKIFREEYFLFGEEYQLCREMAAQGLTVRVVPDAEITHFAGATFKGDPQRLLMASRLGAAIGWEIRCERWGIVLGTLSGLIIWLEHILKLLILTIARPFAGESSDRWARLAGQSRGVVASLMPLLRDGAKYRARVNDEAAVFFNNGTVPPKPSLIKE